MAAAAGAAAAAAAGAAPVALNDIKEIDVSQYFPHRSREWSRNVMRGINMRSILVELQKPLRRVHMAPRGDPVENTAFQQIKVQVVVHPSGPDPMCPNSEQYPPATWEDRNIIEHSVLLYDTRRKAIANFAARGEAMPRVLVCKDYRGVPLHEANELVFAGFSQNKLEAKNVQYGGERTLAMRISGHFTTRNPSRTTFNAGDVIAWCPPPVKQQLKEDGSDGKQLVATDKFPTTEIVEIADSETGDRTTCEPVPKRVNAASMGQRFYALHEMLEVNPNLFNSTQMDDFLYHGNIKSAKKMLEHMFRQMGQPDELELTDCNEEVTAFFHRISVVLDALISSVEGNDATPFIQLGYIPLSGIRTLDAIAGMRRTHPGQHRLSRKDAEIRYYKEIRSVISEYVRDVAPINEDNDLEGFRGWCNEHVVAPGARRRLPRSHEDMRTFAAIVRMEALRAVMFDEAQIAICWNACYTSYNRHAHAFLTADSAPGHSMSGTLLRQG